VAAVNASAAATSIARIGICFKAMVTPPGSAGQGRARRRCRQW
jgi:hypothetical protein